MELEKGVMLRRGQPRGQSRRQLRPGNYLTLNPKPESSLVFFHSPIFSIVFTIYLLTNSVTSARLYPPKI